MCLPVGHRWHVLFFNWGQRYGCDLSYSCQFSLNAPWSCLHSGGCLSISPSIHPSIQSVLSQDLTIFFVGLYFRWSRSTLRSSTWRSLTTPWLSEMEGRWETLQLYCRCKYRSGSLIMDICFLCFFFPVRSGILWNCVWQTAQSFSSLFFSTWSHYER